MQQDRFDIFREEYNTVRPHEALGQRCPGTVYRPSPREYREPAERAEYPLGLEVRGVKGNGVFHWRGQAVFLGEALAHDRVGLAEVGDGCWAVYFMHQPLGIVDERRRKVLDAGQAIRQGLVDARSLRAPLRCASGSPEGPGKT